MKKLTNLIAVFAILLFTTTCNRELGICTACCVGGNRICERDMREATCRKWNKDKKDGYEWKFSDGNVCPPPNPPTN